MHPSSINDINTDRLKTTHHGASLRSNILVLVCASVVALFIALIILELALRVISPPSVFSSRIPLRPEFRAEIHVNLKGVSPTGHFSTDKWGFRGDEPPADWDDHYTIITVGGSTTFCHTLDDHKTWPYLLQEKLKNRCPTSFGSKCPNVWVGNGGTDGQTTRAHIMFMEDVIPHVTPDAVIVLAGVNDLGLAISKDWFMAGNPSDKGGWSQILLRYSRLAQVFDIWRQIICNKVHVVDILSPHEPYVPEPLPKPEPTHELYANPETQHVVLRHYHLEAILGSSGGNKLFAEALEEYKSNVEKIIRLGRSRGIRMIFLTQPLLYGNTKYWSGIRAHFRWIDGPTEMSAADVWKLLGVYNDVLRETCEERGVECFDLASYIPHDGAYFYDPCHFTEKGAETVAQEVADYLASMEPKQYKNWAAAPRTMAERSSRPTSY